MKRAERQNYIPCIAAIFIRCSSFLGPGHVPKNCAKAPGLRFLARIGRGRRAPAAAAAAAARATHRRQHTQGEGKQGGMRSCPSATVCLPVQLVCVACARRRQIHRGLGSGDELQSTAGGGRARGTGTRARIGAARSRCACERTADCCGCCPLPSDLGLVAVSQRSSALLCGSLPTCHSPVRPHSPSSLCSH
jgi:hypothetical protein